MQPAGRRCGQQGLRPCCGGRQADGFRRQNFSAA